MVTADDKARAIGYAVQPLFFELQAELHAAQEASTAQEQAVLMLCAVGRFLDALSDSDGAMGAASLMFMGLAAQIDDLAEGNVGPLLQPARRSSGRRRMPARDQYIAAAAALAMEAEMRAGTERKDAAARVARLLDAERVRVGVGEGRIIEASTVEGWRDELKKGPKASGDWSVAEARWRMVHDRIAEGGQLAPDAAQRWIKALPAQLRGMGTPILNNPQD